MTILDSKMVVLAIEVLAVDGDDDDSRSLDSDDDGCSLYPILSKPAAAAVAVAGDVDVDVGNKDVAHRGFAHDVAAHHHHQQVL